jgi:NhaP-type Na+/H+ or K+/H+ antiporter
VQVSEPVTSDDADDDEVRFALTSEAGLNDGLAFPFTWAAVAISLAAGGSAAWLPQWFAVDVVWRLGCGVAVGLLVGWLLGRLFFSSLAERLHLADRTGGFVAIAATFLAYGAAELAQGYGFVAVFVCACTLRAAERSHRYHRVLHTFVEQVERMLTVVVILLLGGAVARGLLAGVGWPELLVGLAVILVIRPLTGWLGLTPGKTGPRERAVIAFFGVRGVGSLFYVAFALQEGDFADGEYVWALAGLVVVLSVVVHGLTSTPTMAVLDRLRRREARRTGQDVEVTPV